MGKHERFVWDCYCNHLDPVPQQVYYDISLGTAEYKWKNTKTHQKWGRDPWESWRADAMMIYPDRIIMVEVKNRANVGALGQLMAYPLLYQISHELDMPLVPRLVARIVPLPLQIVLDQLEIEWVEVVTPEDEVNALQQAQMRFDNAAETGGNGPGGV
jgi:hypothetical protein